MGHHLVIPVDGKNDWNSRTVEVHCNTLYAYIMYWRNRYTTQCITQCTTQCITQQNCHQSTITQLDYTIYNNHSVISNISSLIQLLQIIRREKRGKLYCVLCGRSDVLEFIIFRQRWMSPRTRAFGTPKACIQGPPPCGPPSTEKTITNWTIRYTTTIR